MAISREDVQRVAALAQLQLTGDEEARMATELGAILEYIEMLRAVPTEGVEETTHPVPLSTGLDHDDPRDGLRTEDVIAAAPDADRDRGLFRVPRVVEGR